MTGARLSFVLTCRQAAATRRSLSAFLAALGNRTGAFLDAAWLYLSCSSSSPRLCSLTTTSVAPNASFSTLIAK